MTGRLPRIKGVGEFFNNLDKNKVKNYLLSSGVKVFLDKLEIAGFFRKIYATTFNYDQHGEIVSIDYLMSDKNKVEAIKDIIKDNGFEKDDCSNIIYIGDGFTDLYAMEYVKKNNGTTIFVYQQNDIKAMHSIKEKEIVSLYTLADYSQNSELSQYISNICGL